MKRVERYIPKAIEVLEVEFSDGKIPKAYNGYISTFGASILQAGLKPTLALFENNQAQTISDRIILTKIILKILDSNTQETSLLRYVINSNQDEDILQSKIVDIAIAIKLSIRTFKLIDKEE